MGLNIGAYNYKSIIDAQALTKVTQKILNPEKQNSVDVSNLDLTKFNRRSLGTDLYAARTNTETAIKASKAAVDFDLNLSKAFSANVQYLNSAAAQSLFTSKENTGKVIVNVENAQQINTNNASASSNINETTNLNKDRRGSNPFSFYMNSNKKEENTEVVEVENYSSINFFA